MQTTNTHSMVVGYILWIFAFTGSHRFNYGKPISGTIWFFTLGLLGIGWLIDLVLYDFWTLNSQISEINHAKLRAAGVPPVMARV
jgi:TM2 domain-containing membrane protein YozV